MDILVNGTQGVDILLTQDSPSIEISTAPQVDITIESAEIAMSPNNVKGVDFSFVSQIIAGGAVRRMTRAQYDALSEKDEALWYFVTNTTGSLREIYAGSTLFAKAGIDGSMGFPYTFPMTFGR